MSNKDEDENENEMDSCYFPFMKLPPDMQKYLLKWCFDIYLDYQHRFPYLTTKNSSDVIDTSNVISVLSLFLVSKRFLDIMQDHVCSPYDMYCISNFEGAPKACGLHCINDFNIWKKWVLHRGIDKVMIECYNGNMPWICTFIKWDENYNNLILDNSIEQLEFFHTHAPQYIENNIHDIIEGLCFFDLIDTLKWLHQNYNHKFVSFVADVSSKCGKYFHDLGLI